jgi:hypothetical protein
MSITHTPDVRPASGAVIHLLSLERETADIINVWRICANAKS